MASSDSEGDIYEIDRILEKRGRGKNAEYLIRWRGFGTEEDSWEPYKSIAATAAEVLAEFNFKEEALKTPRRLSRGRSAGAGDSQEKTEKTVEKDMKQSSTGTTTKTVTTTKMFTKTQTKMPMSDSSSPEASPTVTRKSLRSQTKRQVVSGNKSSAGPSRFSSLMQIPRNVMAEWFQLSFRDLPIIILVTCLLVIGSSFYISGK